MSWMPEGLIDLATTAARREGPILIVGEPGVGKEMLARKIHELSPRASGPFVGINCAGLSPSLLFDVIFGDVNGKGSVASAAGGTYYLSELGELPLEFQRDLLNRSPQAVFSDVRLVADTNRDLNEEVARGWFLPELAAWVSQKVVRIPPLRERRFEILPLARHFASEAAKRVGRPVPEITSEAAALLKSRLWPWNVRELWLTIERAMILSPTGSIDVAHL